MNRIFFLNVKIIGNNIISEVKLILKKHIGIEIKNNQRYNPKEHVV